MPHPPASSPFQDIFGTISAGLQEGKAPLQPDDEMPQAPPPPTAQEHPHQELLANPITKMEIPPKHRTTPDRNGFGNLPREWAIHNGTLRWDKITPGLQAISLHSLTEPTDTRALPADRLQLLLTIQRDVTITPTEADPIGAAPAHAVHMPPPTVSAPMTVHPGPTPWQAHNDRNTHTWHHRWEDIRGDLHQEQLGLRCTHHTLDPVRGVA